MDKKKLLEKISDTNIREFLDKLNVAQQEAETMIKDSMKLVAPPKLRSLPKGRQYGKIIDGKFTAEYNPYRTIKINMNEDVFNQYEKYCLIRSFTPSDFFIDLMYLLTYLDEKRLENPDITLREFCNNPTMLKLLFEDY